MLKPRRAPTLIEGPGAHACRRKRNEDGEVSHHIERPDVTGPAFVPRPEEEKGTGKDIAALGGPASILRILRKEVIQPQVPLRLPCYDFTPVADLTVVGCLLEG